MSFLRNKRLLFALCVLLIVATFLLFSAPGRLAIVRWNEAVWDYRAIRHYRYTFKNESFAFAHYLDGVVIEVHDNQTISLIRKSNNHPIDPAIFREYDTMPKYFQRLAAIIGRHPTKYIALYDLQTGVPRYVTIDFSASTTDDEYILTVTDFEVLP